MQIIKFLHKTYVKTLLKFTEITKYLVKMIKIKVFSHTIVRFLFKCTGISHITCISYCFSTSYIYLTSVLTSEQIIAPIQAIVRNLHMEC